jgi:hypothetical protein
MIERCEVEQGGRRCVSIKGHASAHRMVDDVAARIWEELGKLRIAARYMLEASAPGVPETEGMRRVQAIADLIGFDAGPLPPTGMPDPRSNDYERMQAELARLANVIAPEIERTSPGWAFALFVFEVRADPHRGHVLMAARDRDLTLAAVAKWVHESLEKRKAGAQG